VEVAVVFAVVRGELLDQRVEVRLRSAVAVVVRVELADVGASGPNRLVDRLAQAGVPHAGVQGLVEVVGDEELEELRVAADVRAELPERAVTADHRGLHVALDPRLGGQVQVELEPDVVRREVGVRK